MHTICSYDTLSHMCIPLPPSLVVRRPSLTQDRTALLCSLCTTTHTHSNLAMHSRGERKKEEEEEAAGVAAVEAAATDASAAYGRLQSVQTAKEDVNLFDQNQPHNKQQTQSKRRRNRVRRERKERAIAIVVCDDSIHVLFPNLQFMCDIRMQQSC